MQGETGLNLETGRSMEAAEIQRTTDPVILPQPYASPADFSAQYPTPLDPTELIAMCEEVSSIADFLMSKELNLNNIHGEK